MAFTPTDPTKAEVRITGTAPNQQLDFYIPRGAKGEPGGWTASIVIAAGTSLNDVVTSGLYLNPQSNVANGPSNSTNGGHLEVIATAGYVYQRYTPIAETRETYVRYRTSGLVWSAWSAFNTTRVDQTAGRAIYQWDDLNNREQLIYGDTGWRDVKGLTINGWTSTVLQLRRVGYNVTLTGIITATSATSDHYLPVQSGFTPSSSVYHGVASNTGVPPVFRPLGTDSTNHYVTSGGTSGTYHIQANYPTVSAWPTTLPGTAIGSIPNL